MGDGSSAYAAWLASFDREPIAEREVIVVVAYDEDEVDPDTGARLDSSECNCADADCTCPERAS